MHTAAHTTLSSLFYPPLRFSITSYSMSVTARKFMIGANVKDVYEDMNKTGIATTILLATTVRGRRFVAWKDSDRQLHVDLEPDLNFWIPRSGQKWTWQCTLLIEHLLKLICTVDVVSLTWETFVALLQKRRGFLWSFPPPMGEYLCS